LEDWWDSFRNHLKIAAKSVRYHYRLYLPFFAAIFVFQLFFGVLFFSAAQSEKNERALLEESYTYHTVFYQVNEGQRMFLESYAYGTDNSTIAIYDIVRIDQSPGFSAADRHYDIYLWFRGNDPAENYEKFQNRYYDLLIYKSDDGTLPVYSDSPLLTGGDHLWQSAVTVVTVLLFVVGTMLMTVLYYVRIQNFKFEYGIYMAFGADYRKLIETSAYEMLVVILLAFVPACGCAYGIAAWIHGGLVPLALSYVVKVLVLSLLIGLISCLLPMLVVSKIFPLRHILGADNAHHVTSPRRSFSLRGRSLVPHYAGFSLFRFRTFYAKILLTVTAFVVLSVGISYFSTFVTEQQRQSVAPEFVLRFGGGLLYDEEIAEELLAIDGVAYTQKQCETIGWDINSHLMFLEGQGLPLSALRHPQRYETYFSAATERVSYRACDEELLQYLSRFSHEGDMTKILTDDRAVIISETMNNTRTLSVEPGDKIYAAVQVGINPESEIRFSELMYMTGDALFRGYLEYYEYEYIELTVAAVLKDYPTGSYLPVFLSMQGYHDVVAPFDVYGQVSVGFDEVAIYPEADLGSEALARLEKRLSSWAQEYGKIALIHYRTELNRQIALLWKVPSLLTVMAVLLAGLVPVIALFAQLVFYRKRRPEMDALYAIGAKESELAAIHRYDGMVLAVLSAILSTIGSIAVIATLYRLMQQSGGAQLFYPSHFPYAVFAAAVLLSALLAYTAVMLSYRRYVGERRKQLARANGEIQTKGGKKRADSRNRSTDQAV